MNNRIVRYVMFVLMFTVKQVSSQTIAPAYDVVVYGGSSAGVIAAYTAKQMGKTVLLIEPGKQVGGLTTGGLGFTDIGNKYAINGLSLDFYRRIGQHYGKFEQWIFEPSVAALVYEQYIKKANLNILYSYRIISAKKKGTRITSITIENSQNPSKRLNISVKGKVFIDASYEGDLMARAGVSYTVGREDNRLYNETVNGVQLKEKHQFPNGIDPYKVPGKPESGLLWGVSSNTLAPQGSGNKMVQAYNFRICLSRDPKNRIEITQPDDYDPKKYELLIRLVEKNAVKNIGDILKFDIMPNNKSDINNNGAFSTDMIGMNWDYPDAGYEKRAEIQKSHENYTKGLLYFIGNDLRMPEHIRNGMKKWGYPKDEYQDNGHWSPQMYVREARRMVGSYVMTEANCFGKEVISDGVGMAAYKMDSHNTQRLVVNGMVKNEGDVQMGGFGPYPISYRSLIPKPNECTNLLVPICISASHIAYGSIRMEPVFMALGQSSGVAAVLAIDQQKSVQDIDVNELQNELRENPLADKSTPDILIDNDHKKSIIVKGNWKLEQNTKGCYGPSLYVNYSKDQEESYIRFKPEILKAGEYEIFSYISKNKGSAPNFSFEINNGKQIIHKQINLSEVVIRGQTSGEWVSLGTVNLLEGNNTFVDIVKTNKEGFVIADAILFVPKNRN